jgi:hypothetical protein
LTFGLPGVGLAEWLIKISSFYNQNKVAISVIGISLDIDTTKWKNAIERQASLHATNRSK